ncbi:WD repeat-containing protein 41 isoform X2 [Crotalus tigris]|uniref:WD repeat-containing protein 41 isoform X2 n=1 Tax=Crotalus tigris TaxID=88082 RepID=UPI00192FB5BD|nr:WD repeat-containing protein 41 isoform X2 [Crotalus tigris]
MLRWLIGGGREPQGLAEKSIQTIGEEQAQNPYTELLVLKSHHDIVRFLVAIDDYRFASAGDDGIVCLWNVQTGEKLFELHAHTQKITALAAFPLSDTCEEKCHMILTASADRTVVVWDCDNGRQIHRVSCFHSTVKCLTVLQRMDIWLSGGSDLCVWNRKLDLLCKTSHLIDADITAMIELPKNCVAAAIGKELIILRLKASRDGTEWDVSEIKRLIDHQDNIVSLVSVSDLIFATGSHAGEMIVWDSLDWTMRAYECSWDASLHVNPQQEIKLSQSQSEMSVQDLTSDNECVFAAVGKGIYVYNLQMKRVIAFQKTAHDSTVLHITNIPKRKLISCSEDGSVRMWELHEKQHLTAEPVPSGFFNIWGFSRTNKQANHTAKKAPESATIFSLDLTGDLIGHSAAVQMFLYFGEHGLATCSADHLIILWKDGERESRLRSLILFHQLEQIEDLHLRICPSNSSSKHIDEIWNCTTS